MKFIPNISMLFPELPFLERFAAARALGFSAVEFLFPYDYNESEMCEKLQALSLEVALIDFPPGDFGAGDRGLLCDPSRREEFQRSVYTAIHWSQALSVRMLNCLAGRRLPELSYEEQWHTCVDNLRFAAPILAKNGMRLLLEPINAYDMPEYFLHSVHDAIRLIEEAGHDNVWLQFDIYHMQRTHGDITNLLKRYMPRIAHIQIADSPGRHEPGTGEIRYEYIFQELNEVGYDGYIGMEYIPSVQTHRTFVWLPR